MSTWWQGPLVAFDTETTGPDPESARIVSAHLSLVYQGARSRFVHDWLIDPGVEIPAEATAVHGITTERAVREGIMPTEAIGQVVETLTQLGEQWPVVAFNAVYDLTVLDREARRYGLVPYVPPVVVDPFVLDKQLDRFRKGKRTLGAACTHYGIELTEAHAASADALAAVALVRAMGERAPFPDADVLHEHQVVWRAEQCASLEDYFRRTKDQRAVVRGEWPVLPMAEVVTT